MTKVTVTIGMRSGSELYAEVSSDKIMREEELAREIIDALRRHFPMSSARIGSPRRQSTIDQLLNPYQRAGRW